MKFNVYITLLCLVISSTSFATWKVETREILSPACHRVIPMQNFEGKKFQAGEYYSGAVIIPTPSSRGCEKMADQDAVTVQIFGKGGALVKKVDLKLADLSSPVRPDFKNIYFNVREQNSKLSLTLVSSGVEEIWPSGADYEAHFLYIDPTGKMAKASLPEDNYRCGNTKYTGGGGPFKSFYSTPRLSPDQTRFAIEEKCQNLYEWGSWIFNPVTRVMPLDLSASQMIERFGNSDWIDNQSLFATRLKYSSYLNDDLKPTEFGVYNLNLSSNDKTLMQKIDDGGYLGKSTSSDHVFPAIVFPVASFQGKAGSFTGVLLHQGRAPAPETINLVILDQKGQVVFEKKAPSDFAGKNHYYLHKLSKAVLSGNNLFITMSDYGNSPHKDEYTQLGGLVSWNVDTDQTDYFSTTSREDHYSHEAMEKDHSLSFLDSGIGIAALYQIENVSNWSNVSLPNNIFYGTKKIIAIDLNSGIKQYDAVDFGSCPEVTGYRLNGIRSVSGSAVSNQAFEFAYRCDYTETSTLNSLEREFVSTIQR